MIYPGRVQSCDSCGSITNRFNESHMLLASFVTFACVMQIPALSVAHSHMPVSSDPSLRLSVCLSVHQACSPVCLSLSARSCHIFACCLTTHLARANKVCLIDSHLMIFISHDNTFTYPPYACILLVSILYVCKP